jgi:glycosyltransferase involved in cell wall biosynthesis
MHRILFNMPSQFAGRPSGVARVAFELLHRLTEKSDFQYILRSPWSLEELPDFLKHKPIELSVVRRPSILAIDAIRQALTFSSYCRIQNIDLVVNLDPFGAATGAKARVMIVHDLYFKTIPQQFGWRARLTNDLIYRLMLSGNSKIITVSDATRIDLEHWYPQTRGKITTIHSAPSIRADHDQSSVPTIAGRYIIAVGNVTQNKNFGTLAEAMARLYSTDPDVALVHVGDDPGEMLAETLRRLNSPVRLARFSRISDAALVNLYRHASCLCVPSLYEGFCLPILEAQICSCPVVCSDRSAMPEVAGTGAILTDPTNSNALAASLKRVLDSPVKAATLVRLGLENAARFSWDQTAQRYHDLFEHVLSRGST